MSAEQEEDDDDRRRLDRRTTFIRLADYTVPEVRKALITTALLVTILGLFLYMIHEVAVAIIAGVVLAIYMIPFQNRAKKRLRNPTLTAIVTIVVVIVPLITVLVYSWVEISGAAAYLSENREDVAARVTEAIQRLPFGEGLEIRDDIPRWVEAVAQRSAAVVDELQETLDIIVLSIAVFLFTTFYVLTDREGIAEYIRSRIPGRYEGLAGRIGRSVRQVTYGALYATFLTQLIKSVIVLAMNLLWDVPLAVVLAIASFFIGFLPIVGSWSIYVPVAVYLMVFRDNVLGGVLMIIVGFFLNTLFISMYLRPRIAAERSGVLNFYWMFIALVTGVYTFGLAGIVIGPILIALLRAVFEAVTDSGRRAPAGTRAAPSPDA
ncbi:MAG: AI-2E family transporter [Gemmatimonadetes bacterium]|nr:AI-2E family transporter [Gemmatimonadota bacterium]